MHVECLFIFLGGKKLPSMLGTHHHNYGKQVHMLIFRTIHIYFKGGTGLSLNQLQKFGVVTQYPRDIGGAENNMCIMYILRINLT